MSLTFNAREILKESRGSTQKKPHAYRHGGRRGQEEMCTHPTTDGGQTDGHWNMVDGLSDSHRDTTDGDQIDDCKCSMFG